MENNNILNEYNIAASEMLDILNYLPDTTTAKIPIKFFSYLKDNADPNYRPNFDYSGGLEKVTMDSKTRTLLALVYRNYLCTPEEQKEYDEILLENEREYQKEIRKKYNPDNIFKNKNYEEVQTMEMIEYKQNKWYTKVFNIINKLLNKK